MLDLQKGYGFMGGLSPSATLSITAKAKALVAEGKDVCAMSAGEPDFDTPAAIKNAAIAALEAGKTKYTPAAGMPELKQAVVEKFAGDGIETTAARVIIAPGAKFSVFSAVAALCGPGDEVIIAAPYWVSYPEMIKAAGATPVVISCPAANNFEIDPAALAELVNDKTKLLILNSPSNPTGAVYRRRTLEAIGALAVERNFMILSDEIYEKLTYDAEFPHVSIASLGADIAERVITVNGFSKAYSMTGWRLGYLTAPLWLAKRIGALQSHTTSNPTTFAQYGALEAMNGDQTPVEEMRRAFATRRDLIFKLMSGIPGVECIRPSGAFYIFCDISSFGLSSWEFCERLLDDGLVAAIPGGAFGDDKCIRLSYAVSPETIEKAAGRIAEFCATL